MIISSRRGFLNGFGWVLLSSASHCIAIIFSIHIPLRYLTAQADFPNPEEQYQDMNMSSKVPNISRGSPEHCLL